ncbi:hypothetical protein C2R22_00850 [Salinigranum rubrum]|uniref:Uncharacterized protein n=1 Tax=Salinigranum rubrum TaxID=755307 RepID=A0A2I8VEL8_9EURY|nr:hypothetical protein C2R22_00850 [Salinigranum rubrum]
MLWYHSIGTADATGIVVSKRVTGATSRRRTCVGRHRCEQANGRARDGSDSNGRHGRQGANRQQRARGEATGDDGRGNKPPQVGDRNGARNRNEARPDAPLEERLVLFLAGDDEAAKETVAELTEQVEFAPLDVGSLRDGADMEPDSPIYHEPMVLTEARAELKALRT